MNIFDLQSIEINAVSNALKLYYNILQAALYKSNPNFDNDKMNQQLSKMLDKVHLVNSNYSKFKGEFMAVSDPVVYKDTNTFKLDLVRQ